MKKRQMTDRLQGMAEDDSVAHVYRIEPNGRPCVAWDNASEIKVGAKLYAAPPKRDLTCVCGAVWEGEQMVHAPRKREWVGLTDEEIDALSQAPSLTDELMDCVDRLGSEADTVDPRVWQHLLVYAPKPEEEPVAWITNGGKGELWWHRSSKFDEEGNLIGPNQDDIPLYTAPPKKQWVGLTLNEAEDFYEKYTDRAELINAIDRFLEEKNT